MVDRLPRIRVLAAVIGLALVALGAITGPALAQTGATATGNAAAEIRVSGPVQLTTISELEFGGVDAGDADGTVILDPITNERTSPGNVVPLHGGSHSRAEFLVTGTPSSSYTITLPPSEISISEQTVERDESGNPLSSLIVIDLLAFSTTLPGITLVGQIGLDGTDTIFVGGTLLVPTTAKQGSYRGDVAVTVSP